MSTDRDATGADALRGVIIDGDAHDRALLGAVHPQDWANPAPARRYNLVVLGGGTAGLVTAVGGAGLGARVALVERRLLGGDCLNFGCVPSKALIRSARAAADVRGAGAFGVRAGLDVQVDGRAVMERIRRLRAAIAPHDSAARLEDLGVDVFLGDGRFMSRDTLDVGGVTLRFARACIATGARPAVPGIPGLAESGYLTNETVFALRDLPRSLAILGGGPIGCELAQAFARLGTRVTLLEAGPRLLAREPEDAAALVARAMESDGVVIRSRARVTRVESVEARVRVHLTVEGAADPAPGRSAGRGAGQGAGRATGDADSRAAGQMPTDVVEADALLVAIGRAPNVGGLGLEAAGVRFDSERGVDVDDRLRTSNPRIFAAGDVTSRFKFTHVADAQARIVLRNALFFGRARASALNVPWCTYTDPELAHAGLSAEDARARGIAIEILRVELADVDRAVLDAEDAGYLEVRVRAGTDRIVGATLVARHAGEMISEITAVMDAGKGLKFLSGVIHPYPTQAEVLKKAGDAMARTALKPWLQAVLRRFLAWRR